MTSFASGDAESKNGVDIQESLEMFIYAISNLGVPSRLSFLKRLNNVKQKDVLLFSTLLFLINVDRAADSCVYKGDVTIPKVYCS